MIVIYSDQTSGFLPGYAYRNPQYFQAPLGRPEKVIVCGDYPNVAAAYRTLGVEVEERPAYVPGRTAVPPPPETVRAKISGDELKRHALDHDGDGKPGGSVAPEQTEDLPAIRAEYQRVIGKRPFAGWDAETLKQKIADAGA